MQETLSFEAMPQAILELMHRVDGLRADISELKKHCQPLQVSEPMIGIDEACKIIRQYPQSLGTVAQPASGKAERTLAYLPRRAAPRPRIQRRHLALEKGTPHLALVLLPAALFTITLIFY